MRIITGCSRSGTSFVAQAIRHLGGDFGSSDALIDGDRWNERGYFENRDVNTLNHRLLFGRWSNPKLWVDIMWPNNVWIHIKKLTTIALAPALCRPFLIQRRGRKLRQQIISLAEALDGRFVKDPRFSYLMQPWTAAVDLHSVVYVVRNPWEVARSMSRQTKLPLWAAYLGWLDAVEKFWRSPPDVPIHVVDYNAFFDPARRESELLALAGFTNHNCGPQLTEQVFDSTFDDKLRTSVAQAVRLPKRVDMQYRLLLEKTVSVVLDEPCQT